MQLSYSRMNCIYIRHGITRYTIENRFSGQKDISIIYLDPYKLSRADKLIEYYKPTILMHSPLIRAKKTAEYFLSKHSFSHVIEEPLLIERCFGNMEGEKKSKKNRELLEADKTAESMNDFDLRVKEFYRVCSSKNENIIIVGHSSFYKRFILNFGIQQDEISCSEAKVLTINSY
jgi:broad specificity phosphatase PhoE